LLKPQYCFSTGRCEISFALDKSHKPSWLQLPQLIFFKQELIKARCEISKVKLFIYLLIAIGLTPGGSSTVHIFTNTIHRTTHSTTHRLTQLTTHRTTQLTTHGTTQLTTNWEECGLCPVFAGYTLAFALQLRKKHGKTCQSVRQTAYVEGQN
jgi:hypothetical protein